MLGGEADLVAVDAHHPPDQIARELASAQHRRYGLGVPPMAHGRPHPCQQFPHAERLGISSSSAVVQGRDLLRLMHTHRNDDDRHGGPSKRSGRHQA
jgi:hypothetical protein